MPRKMRPPMRPPTPGPRSRAMRKCMDWRAVRFDWNRARAFLVTAEEGSFSAAAGRLHTGAPTRGGPGERPPRGALPAPRPPPILGRLRAQQPGIEIEIVASNQARDLLRREAD